MKGNTLKVEDLIRWMKQNNGVMNTLVNLGIIPITGSDTHSTNIGKSNYSQYVIQPWHIWQHYNLNPWDADIVKRVLRTKDGDSRKMDYQKIIHICQERIRQLDFQHEHNHKWENNRDA